MFCLIPAHEFFIFLCKTLGLLGKTGYLCSANGRLTSMGKKYKASRSSERKEHGWMRHIGFLKYVVVLVGGIVLVGFWGENSVWSHLRNQERIRELQGEIDQLMEEHEKNMKTLERLKTDPMAVEEIARERYFMKRADEDIFVLNPVEQ